MLLILAVVTISAVNEGSLFSHANNAATAYSKSQEEENTMISNWLTELAKHDGQTALPAENPSERTVVETFYGFDENDLNDPNTLSVTHIKVERYSDNTIEYIAYDFLKSTNELDKIPGSGNFNIEYIEEDTNLVLRKC